MHDDNQTHLIANPVLGSYRMGNITYCMLQSLASMAACVILQGMPGNQKFMT